MSEPRHTKDELKYFRALPLDLKIRLTQDRIKAWVNMFGEDGVYVAFSGGKDSTVLLHLVRQIYPNVKAVFSNTGLEYPEIRQFAMSHDNVDVVYPEIKFTDVLTQYGYPLIGKEVAEAIYYARRIGGGAHKGKARGLQNRSKTNSTEFINTSCAKNRRTILHGAYPPHNRNGTTTNQGSTDDINSMDSSPG